MLFSIATLRAHLRLVRPANLVTAAADILAGFAVSGGDRWLSASLLACSSVCLYAGGVTLNDLLDRAEDAEDRPSRPIPSGLVSPPVAAVMVVALLVAGVLAASRVSPVSGCLALLIAALVCAYNAVAKRSALFGPLCMGLCRGSNLMLGVSAVPGAVPQAVYLVALPILYIGAITCISRAETKGRPEPSYTPLGLLGLSLGLLLALSKGSVLAVCLWAVVAGRVGVPFWYACRAPMQPQRAKAAVRAGVLSLIYLDAALAAAFSSVLIPAMILLGGVLAQRLARHFEVT